MSAFIERMRDVYFKTGRPFVNVSGGWKIIFSFSSRLTRRFGAETIENTDSYVLWFGCGLTVENFNVFFNGSDDLEFGQHHRCKLYFPQDSRLIILSWPLLPIHYQLFSSPSGSEAMTSCVALMLSLVSDWQCLHIYTINVFHNLKFG